MRKSAPEPIANVVKKVIAQLDHSKKQKTQKAILAWRVVAGKELARHSRPLGLKKRVFLVLVDDSAWFYHATLKKGKLLSALKKKKGFEKTEEIQFRIGKK